MPPRKPHALVPRCVRCGRRALIIDNHGRAWCGPCAIRRLFPATERKERP